ncbi:hypothetical protein Sulac_1195 [Sulfobacillus acidophilus DSM 10332]|uniref:Uncharacterized protein n=1 Tax=Sulfobacillus acidophilus (strain ATCC 700253 / DSM 10332 / NAL) TaxID=679936 RepID=G8TV55_SULAD|nr:hypothetical protein Sulac_1195 [Sulfobacillus acidophilus DSM 10332]
MSDRLHRKSWRGGVTSVIDFIGWLLVSIVVVLTLSTAGLALWQSQTLARTARAAATGVAVNGCWTPTVTEVVYGLDTRPLQITATIGGQPATIFHPDAGSSADPVVQVRLTTHIPLGGWIALWPGVTIPVTATASSPDMAVTGNQDCTAPAG